MCIVAYYVFVDNFPHFADRKLLFQIMGLMLVLNIFNIDWFYQGMGGVQLYCRPEASS